MDCARCPLNKHNKVTNFLVSGSNRSSSLCGNDAMNVNTIFGSYTTTRRGSFGRAQKIPFRTFETDGSFPKVTPELSGRTDDNMDRAPAMEL